MNEGRCVKAIHTGPYLSRIPRHSVITTHSQYLWTQDMFTLSLWIILPSY